MNYASAAKGHLDKKGRGVAGIVNPSGSTKSVGSSPKRKPFSSKKRVQVSALMNTPPRFETDTIDLTAPSSYPVVGVCKIKGRRLFEGQENSDVRKWLQEEKEYEGEGGWFKNSTTTDVKKGKERNMKSNKKKSENNANHFAILGEGDKIKSLRQAGRTAKEIGEISARLHSEDTPVLPSWLGSGKKMVDKVPMQDSKDLKVDKKNDDSKMLESDAKEDELDTLEKEYNAEYCVDSDGLQRFGENGTSDSADMSDGSDTDCTNKSGSDKMSRVKSPEQDADPQAMRGGEVKEINNIERSDPNEVFAGIKV